MPGSCSAQASFQTWYVGETFGCGRVQAHSWPYSFMTCTVPAYLCPQSFFFCGHRNRHERMYLPLCDLRISAYVPVNRAPRFH